VLGGEVLEHERGQEVDGAFRNFLDIRVPLKNQDDDIFGVCCISRDITDYKTAVPKIPPGGQEFSSKSMRIILDQAKKIAGTEGTVLLLGESGSGKDYLAQWIHDRSTRSSGPYFTINCAALSPELAESELFGHEAGSFTGARGRKKGMVELAEGGTLLLNEIGELSPPLQSKLLTFLDSMSFVRVGGEKSVTVDARLIAATHRDLAEEVSRGAFLEPLYYRLNVFTLHVPPLRERLEDLPVLVERITAELAQRMNLTKMPRIDSSVIAGLAAYNWPGNVRELKNTLERALMLWDGGPLDLKLPSLETPDGEWAQDLPFPSHWSLRQVTDQITKSMCVEALRRTGGNKKEAAKILRISRDALYRYIRRFNINPDMLS
jgi:transcriptional regulator with PAS, ATPase and Fis domain